MSDGARAAVEALPSLVGMTPAEARAAEVLEVVLDADDTVGLAGAWLGAGVYTPALCDLAASDWDDPALEGLWRRALDELGIATPSVHRAHMLVRGFLERRAHRWVPTPRCACGHACAVPGVVTVPSPRAAVGVC